jgi:hypothetical protein
MNRDLSKIIVIDCDDKAYQLQPRNALHRLKKWDGNDDDTDLVYLVSFLKCKILLLSFFVKRQNELLKKKNAFKRLKSNRSEWRQ